MNENYMELLKKMDFSLKNLTFYYSLLKYIPKIGSSVVNNINTKYYDLDEIMKNVEMGNINIGETINCAGFLSEYSQTFKPMSYISLYSNSSPAKMNGYNYDSNSNSLKANYEMKVKAESLQIPIIKFPVNKEQKLLFLYPEQFSSFVNPVKRINNKDKIIISKHSKPIPLVADKSIIKDYINKQVEMNVKVIILPNNWKARIENNYNDDLYDYNSNFINLISEKCKFIALYLEDNRSITTAGYPIPNNAEAEIFSELYVEGLENFEEKKKLNLISSILPDLASDKIRIMKFGNIDYNGCSSYLTTGDIKVIYKKPNIIGLYNKVPIFNNIKRLDGIHNLNKYSINISRNLRNFSKNHFEKELKTKTAFIFDPTKSSHFDERGIKLLKSIENDYRKTINWYKQQE